MRDWHFWDLMESSLQAVVLIASRYQKVCQTGLPLMGKMRLWIMKALMKIILNIATA